MAANRKLPFGYEMQSGTVVPHPDESEIVRIIFQKYVSGCSYKKLTQELCRQPVPYLPGKTWNKNMIARILADNRYLGTEIFPQVIDPQLYHTASEHVPPRAPARKKSALANAIQRSAVCGICGAKAGREPCSHGKERWYCPDCKAITATVSDRQLERGVGRLLEQLLQAPQTIVHHPEESKALTDTTATKETAFRELLNTPSFDEALARQMALDLAAARLDALGNREYEVLRIRHILETAGGANITSLTLLRQIAEAVLIHPDGGVSLKLKNGQVIEEE